MANGNEPNTVFFWTIRANLFGAPSINEISLLTQPVGHAGPQVLGGGEEGRINTSPAAQTI